MKQSVVIIGGGLGGLFTGAILSHEGLEVTVVEKNSTLGGGLQSFCRFGQVYDTGMHVIAGLREGGSIRRICEYIGVFDKMRLHHMGPEVMDRLYFAEDGETYDISMGRDEFVAGLAKKFPHQRDNLRRYIAAIYSLVEGIDLHHLRPSKEYIALPPDELMIPADKFIGKYISDSRLRSVVAYMNPLYSGRKNETPAYVHAIITVLYLNGSSRFVGGSYHFAETLGKTIEENGGTVIKGDGVACVHSQDRRVTGITTKKGLHLSADWYVSAIHPCTFLSLLDNPGILSKAYRNRLDSIPNSYSSFTVYLKLKPNSFRYIPYTGYYMNHYDEIWEFGAHNAKWPMGFLYMTPPEENQGEYSSKMIIVSPMQWRMVKQWENTALGRRTSEYTQWKAECAQLLIDDLSKLYPNLRECIEDINTASPLTIRDWYGVKEGAMCGYSKDINNLAFSQVPVVTKIPNLLFTGQNCDLHGFCGVPLTAINTCEAILGQNHILNKLNNV